MDANGEFHKGVTEFTTELYDKIIEKQGGEPLDVKEVFEKCGVKELFGASANLSKLSKCKLTVSDALHKAILEVDEEGATAAAATYFRTKSSASFGVVKMRVEHPFVVALICDSKLPVFIGHVVKPEYI
ncbi:hypothetical protein CRM22_009243 [Opisthorchis felineus]|uniref:Serpin domain-containing protein n=1 Tax=Opisthorchis felineus TaxID=147828 RepID=A0A4S2LFH1_OPIFE|nr:hypothetical protein CRM22_009243 [Opisthorchis felineus]